MPFKVFDSILMFTVLRHMEIFDNLGSSRLRLLEMRFNIIDEYGQALSSITQLLRTSPPSPRTFEHDPCLTQMHLRAVRLLRVP